jgi:hypothetical protein
MRTSIRMLLAVLLLSAIAVVQHQAPAFAGVAWCWEDPTLVINGKVVHINLGVPQDQRSLVTRSTLVVTVPEDVPANLSGVSATNFPIAVTLVRSGTWDGSSALLVTANAVVYASDDVATALQVWQANTGAGTIVSGTSGTKMSITFDVR